MCTVSVCIVTYNHGRFIAQALDSVLMQKVNFDYEIVVGEDDSSDGTREIVLRYRDAHPDTIRVFLHDHPKDVSRINGRKNFVHTIMNARGKYVALLEGDDFWISPEKLQKQVDFLEAHPECTICFHNIFVRHEGGEEPERLKYSNGFPSFFFTLREMLSHLLIPPTCSVMFRNRLFHRFPDWFEGMPGGGDWPLHVLNAQHGKIGYLDEVLGCYRIHPGGIWSPLPWSDKHKTVIDAARMLNEHLGYRYDREIRKIIGSRHILIAEILAGERDLRGALRHSLDAVRWDPGSMTGYRKIIKKVLLKGFLLGAFRGKTQTATRPPLEERRTSTRS
jgi:glycosyltransferase involved in cell wall biosynthesis